MLEKCVRNYANNLFEPPRKPSIHGNLRVHAHLFSGRFQVRLVMTTSISLRMCIQLYYKSISQNRFGFQDSCRTVYIVVTFSNHRFAPSLLIFVTRFQKRRPTSFLIRSPVMTASHILPGERQIKL